jgi:hypothetical protein
MALGFLSVLQYCVQRLKLPCRFNAKILKGMTVKSSLTRTLNAQELVERVLGSVTPMRKRYETSEAVQEMMRRMKMTKERQLII